jgi:tetratricopeptide (TPR) repeat protein
MVLRGQYLFEQRTPDTMRLALACFADATRKDPADAEAWAGLANAYLLMHEYGVITMEEAHPAMKAAADRAMKLQPAMSEPHSTLGFADFFWMADSSAAEAEFRTALQLDPSSATAHSRYGAMLTYEARFSDALRHLDLAQQLDPKSTAILANRAFALGLSGRRDEAIALLSQVGYNDRNASVLHHLGVLNQVEPRNLPVYLEQYRRLAEFRHDEYSQQMYEEAERTLHAYGETAMWRLLLRDKERVTPKPNTVDLDLPRYEAFLGEKEKALDDLETMARSHKAGLIGILVDPAFVSLHHDPRFTRLLVEVGLPLATNLPEPPETR